MLHPVDLALMEPNPSESCPVWGEGLQLPWAGELRVLAAVDRTCSPLYENV